MSNTPQVITPQRLREINQVLGAIISARDLLDKAERCGQDVSADRADLDTAEAQLNQWKKEFAPTAA